MFCICVFQVIIDDLDNSITYTFPCQRWLSKDEDDGQIFRDLVAGVGASDAYAGMLCDTLFLYDNITFHYVMCYLISCYKYVAL